MLNKVNPYNFFMTFDFRFIFLFYACFQIMLIFSLFIRLLYTFNWIEVNKILFQCSHRLEKYLNLEGFLEKTLKIKSALKVLENHSKALKSP